MFDFTDREFKLRETEIATDIENNKYTMSSVEVSFFTTMDALNTQDVTEKKCNSSILCWCQEK